MKENFDFKLAWQDVKKDLKPGNIRKTLWKYFLIILGSILLAAGDELFLVPYGIVSGGVAGIGIILQKAFQMNSIETNLTISIAQWILFAVGFVLLGVRFSFKTLISTFIYPVFLFVFQKVLEGKMGSFFYVGPYVGDNTALILAGCFGGVLVGLGCALTFIGGGSTGGTDCISLAITKYFNIKAGITSLLMDSIIIFSNIFFDKSVVMLIIGIASAFFCSTMIDKIYIGSSDTYTGMIVSDKWEEINGAINAELERGTTLYDCYGGYTGEDKVMVQVVFTKEEYDALQKLVYRIDSNAFLTILKATEVTGYGFRKVPFRINREIQFEEKQKTKGRNKKQVIQKIKDLSKEPLMMVPSEKIPHFKSSKSYNGKDEDGKKDIKKAEDKPADLVKKE